MRHGEVGVDEWWACSLDLDAQLEALQDDDSLRPGPDRARIEARMVEVHQRVWERLRR